MAFARPALAAGAPVLRVVLLAALLAAPAAPAAAQRLPWEVVVAEIEAGRIRNLAQRLSKQNVLYQLNLGGVRKADLHETAAEIDRILQSLERGDASYSIPPPWTVALREAIGRVDALWGPLRAVAVASPYNYYRVTRQFMPPEDSLGDPLLLRYHDAQTLELVAASDQLVAAYNAECQKTGLEVCATARASGLSAMYVEKATKEAVYIAAGIDAAENRKRLQASVASYEVLRSANDESPFFAEALNPERGPSARAARELLTSLRDDWDEMRGEFAILAAGDEENFQLERLLHIHERVVAKVERLTAALVRYASLAYGA